MDTPRVQPVGPGRQAMRLDDLAVCGFAAPEDFWRLREFLVDLVPVTPPGQAWDVRRWDGSYFYSAEPGLDEPRRARTRFWLADGRIVAALMSEGDGELHPQVHPDARHLLGDFLAVAEELAAGLGDAAVTILCYEHDVERQRVLARSGYQRTARGGVFRRLCLGSGPMSEVRPTIDYRMRTTRPDEADHQAIADLLNAAFGRDCHHMAETMGFQAHAPSYRRDLDLVAEAPDGTFAAYAAICWDAANRRAIFEPVCTHPAHRKLGLAAALMRAAMRRARDLGARTVDVETGDMPAANALYDSIGFAEAYRAVVWHKHLAVDGSR